jgi:hypothetical protein
MVEASQAQRSVMEIPAPGHGFWTALTIAVSRRVSGIDIGPCVA